MHHCAAPDSRAGAARAQPRKRMRRTRVGREKALPGRTRTAAVQAARAADDALGCSARLSVGTQAYLSLREAHYLSKLRYADDFDTKAVEALQ